MAFNTRFIGEYQTEIWRDLKCDVTLLTSVEVTRCVERATDDLSRFYPLEAVYEHTIILDPPILPDYIVAPAAGTWKDLTYKPIKPGSDTVTTSPVGTTYTRDTDYTIDYANGRITIIAAACGGSITAGAALLVDYTLSELGIDISAIITNLIRVVRVEHPVDRVPQQFVSYGIWNNFMYIGSQKTGESQIRLTDKEHVAIYYEKPHTAALAAAAPSYPAFLDEVICIGAGAYALLMLALKYEHQAVTDIAYVDTALDKITTEMTGVNTKVTQADAVWAEEVKHILTESGIPGMESYLELGVALIDTSTIRSAAETAMGKVDTEAAAAASYLSDGESKINTINVGDNVPELYRDYANVLAALTKAFSDEAAQRIAEAGVQQEEAELYGRYAERAYLMVRAWEQKRADILTEAARYIDKADAWLGEAANRIANAAQYLEIANRFRQEGLERRNEFWSILRDKAEYRKRISSTPVRQPA